jgi:hypothetical protein
VASLRPSQSGTRRFDSGPGLPVSSERWEHNDSGALREQPGNLPMPDPITDPTASQLLAELEEEVATKLRLIAELRRRLGLGGESSTSGLGATSDYSRGNGGAAGQVRSDEFFKMSMTEAIKRYLGIMKRPQPPRTIADALKAGGFLSTAKDFNANVWTGLKRLEEAGAVANTANGWGLSEWYQGRSNFGEPPVKKGKAKRKRASKSVTKKAAKPPKEATASQGQTYRDFVSEQRKAGKSLAEAAKLWQARKAATTTTVERNREPR